jgi:DNA-binding IclR family transcriptional regulator
MIKSTKKKATKRSKPRQAPISSALSPNDLDDSQLISALIRGLNVLSSFHIGDNELGNHEFAERTGLPKATVSRITFTLAKAGFLTFDQRQRVYRLGPKALNLGFIARADNDLRGNMRPMMQRLADETGLNVGLGVRDKDAMLYLDTWEGTALVGLKVYPGFRMPIFTTAMGRAYLAALTPDELETVFAEFSRQMSDTGVRREDVLGQIEHARRFGFVRSIGDWMEDIGAIAVTFRRPDRKQIYVLSLGGPIYKMTDPFVYNEIGPKLMRFRDQLVEA